MSSRSARRIRRVALATATLAIASMASLFAACATTDLVVGDDTRDDGGGGDASPPSNDGAPLDEDGGGEVDAASDAGSKPCSTLPGSCVAQGTACRRKNDAGTCTGATDFCCVDECPSLVPPAPSFCGGDAAVARFDSFACVVGFSCAPVGCDDAGGACVALTPTSCPNGKAGDATRYSCGSGLGTMCCLPSP